MGKKAYLSMMAQENQVVVYYESLRELKTKKFKILESPGKRNETIFVCFFFLSPRCQEDFQGCVKCLLRHSIDVYSQPRTGKWQLMRQWRAS